MGAWLLLAAGSSGRAAFVAGFFDRRADYRIV
jgi:hypothetical protein